MEAWWWLGMSQLASRFFGGSLGQEGNSSEVMVPKGVALMEGTRCS